MAILYRQPLGKMKGKYGSSVVQHRFGKEVVSLRPDHYETKSEKVKTQRKEFGLKVMFAKAINVSPMLVQCWNLCKIKSISGYHKALSYNSRKIKNDVPTSENVITPSHIISHLEKAAYIDYFSHNFNDDSITFNYTFSKFESESLIPPYSCIVAFFLIFSDGKADRITSIVLGDYVETENIDSNGIKSINIKFEKDYQEIIKKYRLMRGYFAFVKPDYETPKNIRYSYTKFFEVNLNDYYNRKM